MVDPVTAHRRVLGQRGATIVDALLAVIVLGLGAAALTTLLLSSSGDARSAALEGRRAELAQRALDRVRSGLETADSGVVRGRPGGEDLEAVFVRRDTVAPGAVEVRVQPIGGDPELVLEAARPAP